MVKVAIFASGSGTNFENIMQRVTAGELPNIEVTALYTCLLYTSDAADEL